MDAGFEPEDSPATRDFASEVFDSAGVFCRELESTGVSCRESSDLDGLEAFAEDDLLPEVLYGERLLRVLRFFAGALSDASTASVLVSEGVEMTACVVVFSVPALRDGRFLGRRFRVDVFLLDSEALVFLEADFFRVP